jgi:hypothetical protein
MKVKMMRLLLLSGVVLSLSVPVPSHALSCTKASCDNLCGGTNTGACVNGRCICF